MKHLPRVNWRRANWLPIVASLVTVAGAAEPVAQTFDILEYRVLGNTTLPAIEIERAVYPHLGPDRTLADVENARVALETAYRAAGYSTVFVDVPEQDVEDGLVRLRASEGRIDRVRISGARHFSNGRIRGALPSLAPGEVPKLSAVQAELTALNSQTRDRAIVPVLRAGATPGTIDVELKVDDSLPVHGSLELNDRYTADTSRLRMTAALSYDNLFQKQHSLSLQWQTAPEKPSETRAFVASYMFRLDAVPQTSFVLYAVDSKSDIAALGTLSVLGNGRIFGARMVRSLPPLEGYFHSISFGVDYKDFLEDIRLEDDEALQTPISYVDWSLAYSGTVRGVKSLTSINFGTNFGLRGFQNAEQEFADKRFRGAANYFYARGSVQHTRQLPARFALSGRIAAQMSGSPLVSNEQFIIGGVDSVRGYLESTHLGDYGVSGSIELRHDLLSAPLGLPPGGGYVFAFADGGRVSLHEPLPGQARNQMLGSAGIGMRLDGWQGLDLALDVAAPLRPAPPVKRGDARAHFNLRYRF